MSADLSINRSRTARRRVRRRVRRGLTITELLVVALAVAMILAALMPVARRVSLDSGQLVSAANLQKIALAHALYAADWDDRQVTWCPDDLGQFGGSMQSYAAGSGCPDPVIWGFSETGSIWGGFLPCHNAAAGWGNASYYVPNSFMGSGVVWLWSSWAIGAKAFAQYVDGRFYSPTLYAPNDTITIERAGPYLDLPVEFTLLPPPNNDMVRSSYAFSPAAMWHPAVLSKNAATGLWWRSPNSFAASYRSPTVSQCVHPALKTRTIEHNWNLGQPAPVNPAFAGGVTPYFFSHGIDAAPLTLFFDGRVAELANAHVAADDQKALAGTDGEVGLWTRDTTAGALGYYGGQSYDGFVTGHHVLTAGGITGRDILSVEPGDGDGLAGGLAGRAIRRGARPTRIDPPPVPVPQKLE